MKYFLTGGDEEIRTPEGCNTLPPFQGGALDRYATSPDITCLLVGGEEYT